MSTERLAYLDASAFVKLVVREPESAALAEELRSWPQRVSSTVLIVEAVRAAARVSEKAAARAEGMVGDVTLVPPAEDLLRSAARLDPRGLASLDAVHLATALAIGPDLGAFLVYDRRLARAASVAGLTVLSPADP